VSEARGPEPVPAGAGQAAHPPAAAAPAPPASGQPGCDAPDIRKLLVNVADWDGPAGLDPTWLIANAPRPLSGERTWQAAFRHGVLYAAMPSRPGAGQWDRDRHAAILRSWKSLDAWLIEFIDDDEIRRRCLAKAAGPRYGYPDEAAIIADGLTIADFADSLQLPWRGGGAAR
jgi:hypothetical protein